METEQSRVFRVSMRCTVRLSPYGARKLIRISKEMDSLN